MLNIAILSYKRQTNVQIENMIYQICDEENKKVNIDVYETVKDLEKQLKLGMKYDLLSLEVEKECRVQRDAISRIRDIKDMIVILIVENDEDMLDLLDMDVFIALRNPVEYNYFKKVLLKVFKNISDRNYYFLYTYRKREFKILCKNITYFESKGRQIIIHTLNCSTELFNGKMDDVEKTLKSGVIIFLRIHQSYLVNFDMIKSKCKTSVTLIDGTNLPVSNGKKKEFEKMLTNFLYKLENL